MDIVIRDFASEDAEGVQAVALAAWQFTYRDIFDAAFIEQFVNTNYSPEGLRWLITQVQAREHYFAVAEHAKRVVGFCHTGPSPLGAVLYRIYLLPDVMGQGIGKQLLTGSERYLREKGIDTYSCFVHSRNEIGKRFYAKQGFQHVAERDQDDEWFMQKQLI